MSAHVTRFRLADSVELTLLGAIWGASFMFQRVAAPAFGALPMVELRLLFGVAMSQHRVTPVGQART